MEDSFRVRVDRAFGSLSSSSSQPLSSSLWCLTDEELEKREWKQKSDSLSDDDDDLNDGNLPSAVDNFLAEKCTFMADNGNPNPNPNQHEHQQSNLSDYRQKLEDDLRELDEDSGEGTSGGKDVDDEEDELDVRNSIGMDCTLDYEDEEDEYDKVAVGREKSGDYPFIGDFANHGSHCSPYNELPGTFNETSRDPRANHLAAKLRLKEDAEAAKSFSSLHVSDQTIATLSDAQNNTFMDGNNPKSILKRKEDQMDAKTEKRVRFESDEGDKNVALETSSTPDYILNPSKYTHYTFDSSSDMNEESNRQAYMDFLNGLKKSKQSGPDEVPADLSKPVRFFNPKKKDVHDSMSMTSNETQLMHRKSSSIASVNWQEDESFEMEVNVAMTIGNGKRTARQYRSKQSMELDGV